MSIRAIAWAFKKKTGNPLRKLILIKLCDNANDEGYCWPSLTRIADETEISRDSIIRHIKTLEEQKFLEIIKRKKDGVNLPNRYYILMEGVVAHCDHQSQSAGRGSRTKTKRVVAQCDPNHHTEPSKTTLQSVVVIDEIKSIQKIFSGTQYSKIQAKKISELIKEKGFNHVLLTVQMLVFQLRSGSTAPRNPVAHFIALCRGGMEPPTGFVSSAEKARRQREEEEESKREREKIESLKNDREIPVESKNFLDNFLGRVKSL